MQSRLFLAAACLVLLTTLPAQAHHSFAAEFDGTKPVRLVGTITKIEWTNPHSYFYLDVKDSKGEVHNWAVESGNPGALSRRGWKKGDIKLGDALIVDGYLAKDGSRLIDGRRVKLPQRSNCVRRQRRRRWSQRSDRDRPINLRRYEAVRRGGDDDKNVRDAFRALREGTQSALYCSAAFWLGSSALAAAPAAQPVTPAQVAAQRKLETSELQAEGFAGRRRRGFDRVGAAQRRRPPRLQRLLERLESHQTGRQHRQGPAEFQAAIDAGRRSCAEAQSDEDRGPGVPLPHRRYSAP